MFSGDEVWSRGWRLNPLLQQRPDLQFWGGTRIWVASLIGKLEPHAVTQKSIDETYDLRWANDHMLVFDRVADVVSYQQSRIWKAEVKDSLARRTIGQ